MKSCSARREMRKAAAASSMVSRRSHGSSRFAEDSAAFMLLVPGKLARTIASDGALIGRWAQSSMVHSDNRMHHFFDAEAGVLPRELTAA
jgi:hypothetical protein